MRCDPLALAAKLDYVGFTMSKMRTAKFKIG
jgi:hypothetical protein